MPTQQTLDSFDWNSNLKRCLDLTNYGCVGTMASEVWVSTVYFAYDTHFNIYFISSTDTVHMESIKGNGKVAMAINSTVENHSLTGIQLKGDAKIVSDEEVEDAYGVYFSRKYPDHKVDINGRQHKDFYGNAQWKLVKITPSEMWYLDTLVFGPKRVLVPKKALMS
jgi:uncharacterized protein YhbP (UPF0306 family)